MLSENASLAISLGLVLVTAWFKWGIQRAANVACGDADGRGNATFSAANIVWLVLFGLFWLMVVAAIVLTILVPDTA